MYISITCLFYIYDSSYSSNLKLSIHPSSPPKKVFDLFFNRVETWNFSLRACISPWLDEQIAFFLLLKNPVHHKKCLGDGHNLSPSVLPVPVNGEQEAAAGEKGGHHQVCAAWGRAHDGGVGARGSASTVTHVSRIQKTWKEETAPSRSDSPG